MSSGRPTRKAAAEAQKRFKAIESSSESESDSDDEVVENEINRVQRITVTRIPPIVANQSDQVLDVQTMRLANSYGVSGQLPGSNVKQINANTYSKTKRKSYNSDEEFVPGSHGGYAVVKKIKVEPRVPEVKHNENAYHNGIVKLSAGPLKKLREKYFAMPCHLEMTCDEPVVRNAVSIMVREDMSGVLKLDYDRKLQEYNDYISLLKKYTDEEYKIVESNVYHIAEQVIPVAKPSPYHIRNTPVEVDPNPTIRRMLTDSFSHNSSGELIPMYGGNILPYSISP